MTATKRVDRDHAMPQRTLPMPAFRSALACIVTMALCACGGTPPPTGAAAGAGAGADPASISKTKGDSGMFKECQGATLHLSPLAKEGDAPQRTRLEIARDGERRAIQAPTEMQDYTAVGLACTQDKAGAALFVVEYGELPYGCSFCEWYYLYDASGKQLTQSVPPLREVDGQQAPNNDEYSRLLAELGIEHPEVEPFQP